MTEPAFDEISLERKLLCLEEHQVLAFGAACCERILPNYRTFVAQVKWGDPSPLRRALDVLWRACGSQWLKEREVQDLIAHCENSVPDSEDFDSLYTSSAQDAVFAVCSLLDFLLAKDIHCVVNAARYPTDSIDLIVQEQMSLNPEDPELERRILEQPLMQQELRRQKRDLGVVRDLRRDDAEALVALKTRAQNEQAFALPELLTGEPRDDAP